MTTAAPCDLLTWDSEFFGRKIGSVRGTRLNAAQMTEVMRWAEEVNVDCLYLLADPTDPETIRLAERNQFYFQSVRMVLERSLQTLDDILLPPAEGITLRSGTPSDLPHLRPIARSAYHLTRFFTDPCFPRERSAELYDIWLTKNLHHEMADEVVVAEVDGRPVGYTSCQLAKGADSREGVIQLVGVDETMRGGRIGQRVLVQACAWLRDHGMTTVSVTTQGHNVPAVRFYERLGFMTRHVQFWYHKWFQGCEADEGQP
jgi:ribosomal protein S18 acetylase RimI-like enzyme